MPPGLKIQSICASGESQPRIIQAFRGGDTSMKETLLWTAGIVAMLVLGYVTAFRAQDLVWLLVPGIAIVLAILVVSKIFR